MCFKFKDSFLDKHAYSILIILLLIAILYLIHLIYSNINGYSPDSKEIFEAYNALYTTLIIASITIIGIFFNLRDNKLLRIQQEQEKNDELNKIKERQENIRLLISIEVNNNLDTLREFKPKINYLDPLPIEKPSCTIVALNSSYDEIASVFSKEELKILMEFYGELEKLMDDKNWLTNNNDKSNSSSESFSKKPVNFTNIRDHKTSILNLVEKILSLESELDFLNEDTYNKE